MPFLAARAVPAPQATILGAPFDATATHRRGARWAPAAIRWASDALESYSPLQQRDLQEIRLADAGDLDLAGADSATAVERVRAAVAAGIGLPVLLGGEHTVTAGAVAALLDRHPDLGLVVVDAHLDLRQDYEGTRWSHATTLARILDRLDGGRVAVLGARAGTRDEWTRAGGLLAVASTGRLPQAAWAALADRPLYLSVDIDGLDPAHAPGTGNPEPLGLAVDDVVSLLGVLRQARVVGCDVVEVSPPYDPGGRTAMLAAWLVREMILAFAR
ncbi:MAG: agmatinase [Armatimonadota bacterium]|nr:agmatinase [Armatimonadota bacterium]MDR7532816.1 agmatinase [Armatimonadota bacterium]MDR7535180.1 agmatinase [Armatimonadota bacterium]